MEKKITLFIILFFFTLRGFSQSDSIGTVKSSPKYDHEYLSLKHNIVPAGLVSGGLLIEAFNVKKDIQDVFPVTHTKIENYLQYVPVGILYGGDLVGVPHRNTVFNQTKYLVISELVTAVLTHSLKTIIHESRPSGGPHSFPSGHTSQSFSSASVVYNEFIGYNKSLAWSGYLFSTATGVLRVTNQRHWVPDVLVGAGMAILVTNLVYYFHPLKNWDPFHWNNRMVLIPEIDPDLRSFSLNFTFFPGTVNKPLSGNLQ